MRIAIDMDSTLAEVTGPTYERMGVHDITHDDITEWDHSDIDTPYHVSDWVEKLHEIWANDPLHFPLNDETVVHSVQALYAHPKSTVEVVTQQPKNERVLDGKAVWLAEHNIPYDDLVGVPMDMSKAELDYHVYVDDKPSLPSSVQELCPQSTVYLYDMPYNRDAQGPYTRVEQLQGAAVQIIDMLKYTKMGEV